MLLVSADSGHSCDRNRTTGFDPLLPLTERLPNGMT
jgi:hypothetical protein